MSKKKINIDKILTTLLASLLLTLVLYGATPALAADAPTLGTAQSYGILGSTTVTNTGPTVVNGDLGVSPGTAVTGFPPGIVTGTIHAADAAAGQARIDITTAYNNLAGQTVNFGPSGPTDLAGQMLVPGVYKYSSSVENTGVLTLNAGGDPNAVWVFQIGSTLTTGSGSSVVVINGGQDCNVFWQVGSSAILGTTTKFVGNILALESITLNTGATVSGRALARNAAVTLDSNVITLSSCSLPPSSAPTLGMSFSPATITASGVSTLTITLSNPNPSVATLTAALIDNLPGGMLIAATPNSGTTCIGTGNVLASAGGSTVTLPGTRSIPASSTCTVTVDVTSTTENSYVNTLAAGALQTSNGNNAAPALATLTVTPIISPPGGSQPTIGKSFNPATINTGGVSTLTITLSNPNTNIATLSAALIDIFPTGVKIASTPNAGTTCSGTGDVSAIAGGLTVNLPNTRSIPASGTCTVTVDVTAATDGSYFNTLAAGALQTSNGNNAAPALATLTVTPIISPPGGQASISGMKFNDSNNNGINDGEQGLSGWIINYNGPLVSGFTTTDGSGKYSFTALPPGTYTVSETQQGGWIQTTPASPGTYTVVLNGVNVTGKDFGNFKSSQTPPPPVPEIPTLLLTSAGIIGLLLMWRKRKD